MNYICYRPVYSKIWSCTKLPSWLTYNKGVSICFHVFSGQNLMLVNPSFSLVESLSVVHVLFCHTNATACRRTSASQRRAVRPPDDAAARRAELYLSQVEWLSHPSKKYEFVSWDEYSQYMEKWSKCSKPTRSTNMDVLTRLVEGKIYRKPLCLLQIQSFWQIFPKNSRFSLAFNMVFISWFSYRKLRCGCQRENCIILHSLCWSFWVFFAVCDCKHYIPDTYVVKLPIFPETRYTTCSDTQTFNT